MSNSTITDNVKTYYGSTLSTSEDLKTDACCTTESMPDYAKASLSKVPTEVLEKYYGCGIVIPEEIKGCRILDLGSGSGRDGYVLSDLVGADGAVIGVDMTDEQLAVANAHIDTMTTNCGYDHPNMTYLKGDITQLQALDLPAASFDCVVSNCVINLATDKEAVLQGAFALLKEGGELYFSDVYADRRLDPALKHDPILHGECLSGAYYWRDFINSARSVGFADPRLVRSRPLEINDKAIKDKLGMAKFYSSTYRLFKISELETACEDFGQAVRYKGTIAHHADVFQLDGGHIFERGRIYTVCGNTYRMLHETRFAEHFDFWGDFSTHYGTYEDCGTPGNKDTGETNLEDCGC